LTREVLGNCLNAFAQSADLSQYSVCESAARGSFISAIQTSNLASGCLASGKTSVKADQMLALIKPVVTPVLQAEVTAISLFGKAKATRRFISVSTQINRFMDTCLNDGGKLNQSKAIPIFDSLFKLSGQSVFDMSASTFVDEFKKSCTSISAY